MPSSRVKEKNEVELQQNLRTSVKKQPFEDGLQTLGVHFQAEHSNIKTLLDM